MIGRRSKAARRLLPLFLIAAITPLTIGAKCFNKVDAQAVMSTHGDVDRGRVLLREYGCGTCHQIGGVAGARGNVGPSLDGIAGRAYLAGSLPNDATALKKWIQHPQQIIPGNAMPEMNVSDRDAAAMAAYLYSRK
jgi:cytochrome c2